MANTRKTTATAEEPQELNLETKVTLRSIAEWKIGLIRRVDGTGDVDIPPKGSVRLSRNEIIAQVQNGNKAISGIDGLGSHATLIIDDSPTRIELGFESETKEQFVFSDDIVKKVFSIKDQKKFEDEFKKSFVTRAEKFAVIDAIDRLGINDHEKIKFAGRYTGLMFKVM